MSKEVRVVKWDVNVSEVSSMMAKQGRGCLVVVTGEGKAVGIVTERDVVRKVVAEKVDPSKVLASDVMSTPLVTIDAKATTFEAAKKMIDYGIRRLPVLDGGRLVGIITTTDLARELAGKNDYEDAVAKAISRITTTRGPYG